MTGSSFAFRSRRLGDTDLERIQEAVRQAERESAAEVVTFLVEACDDYPEARWRGSALGAVAVLLPLLAVDLLRPLWGMGPLLWLGLGSLGAGAGLLVSHWEPARRLLTSAALRTRRAERRAEVAFLEERVFATRAGTGILVFLAFFERAAFVIGDEAVRAAVPEDRWTALAERLVSGLRSGRTTEAILEAVAACAALTRDAGFPPAPDDTDELPDTPRVRPR
ncbi:MAG: hypothetical protein R3E10_18775 [Gemmatimonadota bacterium]